MFVLGPECRRLTGIDPSAADVVEAHADAVLSAAVRTLSKGPSMRHDIELAYLGIEVPDPGSLTPFFAEVIGLLPGEQAAPEGTVTWRNDDKAHRVISTGTSQRRCLPRLRGRRRHRPTTNHAAARRGRVQRRGRQRRRVARTVGSAGWHRWRPLGGCESNWSWGFRLRSHPSPPLMPGGFLTEDVGLRARRVRHHRLRGGSHLRN